jgi:lambda repressor-like predicted transcriptional regulator
MRRAVLLTALLLALPYGSGTAAPAPPLRPSLGDRDTLPLSASAETLVFVGLAGDQVAGSGRALVEDFLAKDWGVTLVGEPVRSLATRDRAVFAVRTADDPGTSLRRQRRVLKRHRLQAEQLQVTALALLGNYSYSQLQTALRSVERREDKIWAFFIDNRENVIWAFHEAKLDPDGVLDAIRRARIKVSFYHQELELEAGGGTDVETLAGQARDRLDLVGATARDGSLVLDLYLRGVGSFLALQRGRKTVACPDVLPFLREVPASDLAWKVTLDNRGYPFVN